MKIETFAASLAFGASLVCRGQANPVAKRWFDDPDADDFELKCFDSGRTTTHDYFEFASDACYSWDPDAEFAGVFGPSEEKTACMNLHDGSSISLAVTNWNKDNSYELNDEDCIAGFYRILGSCSSSGDHYKNIDYTTQGGTRYNAGWLFVLDPNDEKCPDKMSNGNPPREEPPPPEPTPAF